MTDGRMTAAIAPSGLVRRRFTVAFAPAAVRTAEARRAAGGVPLATEATAAVRVGVDGGAFLPDGPLPAIASTAAANLPNAISVAGYAATLAWLSGASSWWAVAGLIADEADGRVARATGTASAYGGLLDWAIDLTLTGLVAWRLGAPWLLLAITPAQAYLREREWRPAVGSARAVLTLVALAKGV